MTSGVAQVVRSLADKHKTLSSIPSTAKNKGIKQANNDQQKYSWLYKQLIKWNDKLTVKLL
jgi:hypothetical protein